MNKKYIVIGFLVFATSVFVTMSSYAYFSSNITGTGSITFATWSFETGDEKMSFTTDLGDLYPGIDKHYQISLSALASEIPVSYTIEFNNPHNIPDNLKFYRDQEKNFEINPNGGTLTGTVAAGTSTVITIYYDWPYGSAAEEYVPGNAWFNMTINGHQEDPSGGA